MVFILNNIFLSFPFSSRLWWRQEYFEFDADKCLDMLSRLKKSIILFKSLEESQLLLQEYSDYYKDNYLSEVLIGEENVSKQNICMYFNKENNIINRNDALKIANLKSAVDFLFSDIFFPNLPIKKFNVNLAIKLNKLIGEKLFKNPGEYRKYDAMASQENFYYLEPQFIQKEMEKLFQAINSKFSSEITTGELIKLGSQFLIHFLTIHPFENGNGRVARLLLSYLLSSVTLVPLSIYPKHAKARKIYLDCLRTERLKTATSESDLASLILESAFFNLEDVCKFLDIYPD